MTYEILFKEVIDSAYASESMKFQSYIGSIDMTYYTASLRDRMKSLERLKQSLSNMESFDKSKRIFDISTEKQRLIHEKEEAYTNAKFFAEEKRREKLAEIDERYSEDLLDLEKRRKASITPLQEKHSQVLAYKDTISFMLDKYGITASDITISEDLTAEEFSDLVDVSLSTCKEICKKRVYNKDWITKWYKDENPCIGYIAFATTLLLSYILMPIISIVAIALTIKDTAKIHSSLDKLRIVESLMTDIDFEKFIKEEDFEEPLKETDEADTLFQELLEKAEELNPEKDIAEITQAYESAEVTGYKSQYEDKFYNEMLSSYTITIARLRSTIAQVEEEINAELSKMKGLGDYVNPSYVIDNRYMLGERDGIIEREDFGLTNILFKGTYDEMISTVTLCFMNVVCSVQSPYLEIIVMDRDHLGAHFGNFFKPELNQVFSVMDGQPSDLLKDAQKSMTEAISRLETLSILEYNKQAEELGMIPQLYKVYMILSADYQKLLESEEFITFLREAPSKGIFIWIIAEMDLPYVKTITKDDYREDWVYKPTTELIKKVRDLWIKTIKDNKPRALDYYSSCLTKVLPKELWWKGSTVKGINIRFGNENGDPGKPTTYILGDANVHALFAGATGAGKSVLIDTVLHTLFHEYSPKELEVYYIDMKNVEAAKYTENSISRIPHLKVISGTSDGEYCLSIFDSLFEEMLYRCNVLCPKYKVSKVEDLRKKFGNPEYADYNPECDIPRIICLVDEFQVMFDSSRIPQKLITKISARITSMVKLARAAGIHLIFTSQEMKGTLDKNVLDNFSLRLALRCTKDVSTSIIGNDASGTIRDKFGWCYVNDSAGQDATANKLIKTPFAPNSDIMKMMTEYEELSTEFGLGMKTRFFDEKEAFSIDTMYKSIEKTPSLGEDDVLVFGEKTVYSTNTNPVNTRIMNDTKENLFVIASNADDYANLLMTIIHNLKNKREEVKTLIMSSDKDASERCELVKYQQPGFEDMIDHTLQAKEFLNLLEDIKEERSNSPKEKVAIPAYILTIGWDKLDKVGVNVDYKIVQKLEDVIRNLNKLNLHFIFVVRSNEFPRELLQLCNHRVVAKVDARTASRVIDDDYPEKFPEPNADDATVAVHKFSTTENKFKIYKNKFSVVLKERSI